MTSFWLHFSSLPFSLFPACVWPWAYSLLPAPPPRKTSPKLSKQGIHSDSPSNFKGGSRGKHLGAKRDRAGDLGRAGIWHTEGDRKWGREKNGSASMMDGGDWEGWCLLLIKVRSDIKQGVSTWQPTDKCGHGCNMIVCESVPTRHRNCFPWGLKITHRAVRPSESPPTVKSATTHPACPRTTTLLLFLKPTAALVGKQLFISSLFSRPRWLDLPAGWVALLPGSHLHAKCVFICFPDSLLWRLHFFFFFFYNWVYGGITQPPQRTLMTPIW